MVYHYPLEALEQMGGHSFSKQDTLYMNSFVKYLIDTNDSEAINYLILAKKDATLNVYPYFRRNPFSEDFQHKYRRDFNVPGYKRHFAKKMLSFQNEMNTAKSKEAKALASYQYAVGLMHATSDCWALLHYKQGENLYPKFEALHFNERTPAMEEHCRELFDYVLETTQSIELKAKCLAAQVWMWGDDGLEYARVNGNWFKKIIPNSIFAQIHSQLASPPFADTEIAKLLFAECDVFRSYAKE